MENPNDFMNNSIDLDNEDLSDLGFDDPSEARRMFEEEAMQW